jgi:hypothetical protein
MRRSDSRDPQTIRENLLQLNVEYLKPLVGLIGENKQGRKEELVQRLATSLGNPNKVRSIYESLNDLGKKAVQEATHDPGGVLDAQRFRAKYGGSPNMGGSGRYHRDERPTELRLLFSVGEVLPSDLRATLLTFVPAPPPLQVTATDDLPTRVRPPHKDLDSSYWKPSEEEVDLRVRETERDALQDIQAMLRLVDAGKVQVSDTTRRPTQATLKTIGEVLAGGEFYSDDDRSEYAEDPASDLAIKAFAWPLILQAAGLVQISGKKLQLSPAGRKATAMPAAESIRPAWEKWLNTNLLDEFSRVNVIKGQQSKGKGGLTAVLPRRRAVVDVLAECPAGKWIEIEELFRLIKVLARDFHVSHNPWKLYLCEQRYGSLGYDACYPWDALQGRYVLAFLFEYAATLGLLDVAYIGPEGSRNDFHDRWGADELSCLSRYDGLMFVRINALGAWCLGLADEYKPAALPARQFIKVLPNLDVVASNPPLNPADTLFLDRIAERKSEAVWHLDAAKILEVIEEGFQVAHLREFLRAGNQEPLPETVAVFLNDLEAKTSQLQDLGPARLIACADTHVAQVIANDRRLRKICQLAGERQIVFRPADEAAVRRGLRELGYVLPPRT